MKVCIISEGCYPVLRGGLSEWTHLLIKTLKDIQFDVLCITATGTEKPVYEKQENVSRFVLRALTPAVRSSRGSMLPGLASRALSDCLRTVLEGKPVDFEQTVRVCRKYAVGKGMLTTRPYWDLVVKSYRERYSRSRFVDYFWTHYGLSSILLDMISDTGYLPRADVYHALSTGYAGFISSLAKVLHGSPIVLTEQGLYLVERRSELARQDMPEVYRDLLMRFSESIVKTSYEYADVIVPPCLSHVRIEQELGADLRKVRVIKNGIECDRFIPGPSRNGAKPTIGCFARVVPIKGITDLIRAAGIVLQKHKIDFVVVGEIQHKEYHAECLRLIKELGLQDNFKFIGHTNALEWYHRVDIFTLSSISEGVPYALLEAMSCGLPCVCTAVGGVPEIIEDGVGFLVPPGQPEKLAEKFCLLLENKDLRQRMGRQGSRIANSKYTLPGMAGEFRREYEGLLNGRRRG
ncbi:MAG: GT4 family glycosyltransferase PelF [Dehalococcoidia bacterium]|nr:GT4 family glycosyltransferase PelF [Dehalococcoidia bacterium]